MIELSRPLRIFMAKQHCPSCQRKRKALRDLHRAHEIMTMNFWSAQRELQALRQQIHLFSVDNATLREQLANMRAGQGEP